MDKEDAIAYLEKKDKISETFEKLKERWKKVKERGKT